MALCQPAQVAFNAGPGERVVDQYRMAFCRQPVGQIGADEAGAASDPARGGVPVMAGMRMRLARVVTRSTSPTPCARRRPSSFGPAASNRPLWESRGSDADSGRRVR